MVPSHLLMVLINDSAGVFITASLANPTSSQLFSISGVPAGTYMLYTILDLNNNGLIDWGDISDTEIGVPVTVESSDVNGVAVSLTAADADAYVQTKHSKNGAAYYSLTLGAFGMMKRPVNVSVSGPQIPISDLGLSNNGIEPSKPLKVWRPDRLCSLHLIPIRLKSSIRLPGALRQ